MKNFSRRGMALLLSVLLLCSLSVGALAADEVGITAVLDNAKLTKSDAAQTVTLTIAPESALSIAGYGFTVNVPDGWSITSVSNDDPNAVLTGAHYNLKNGMVGFQTADAENYSISKYADVVISVPAGTEAGTYTITINGVTADADYGFTPVQTNATTAFATLTIEDGATPPTPEVPEGYSVSAAGDASINIGADATVSLNVTHKDGNAYNAYYFEVTYDSTVLTYKGVTGGAAVDSTTPGVLKIAGYGAEKESGTAAAVLTFTGKAAGTGDVTITKANVDASAMANAQDAPEAAIAAAAATITVGGYSVTLPDGFTGAPGAEPNKDYTFTGGEDSGCYDVTATMGGASAEVTRGDDGIYTIRNVTGEIVVTATPKSYSVTVTGSGTGDVSGAAETAAYKTDYTFTLTKKDGYTYTVTVTVNGAAVAASVTAEGVYTIPGTAIRGNVTVSVEKTVIPGTTTTITIDDQTGDVTGAKILTAKNGETVTFKINKQDGYDYTAKAGDTTLAVAEDGTVTIPGSLLTGAPLTVTVTKTARNPYGVEVYEYVKLSDAKSVWLVVAKSDSTLVYGTDVMFTSEKYGGYCWLVISGSDADTVKAEAVAAVKTGEGSPAAVAYTGDVNGTGKVDVNDAQLVYNIYNAVYGDFTATSMAKFLAADVNGDKAVNVDDAAAVVNTVLGR